MGASERRKYRIKIAVFPARAKKPYYKVWVYVDGERVASLERILNPDFPLKWFLYNQSLLSEGYARIVKTAKGTVKIAFATGVERHFKLFTFYLCSILNTRSARRADCYARCWSSVDAPSPVVDTIWELFRHVHTRRFSRMLRGFCSCR